MARLKTLCITIITLFFFGIIGSLFVISTDALNLEYDDPFRGFARRFSEVLIAPSFSLKLVKYYSYNVAASSIYYASFAVGIASAIWWASLIIKAKNTWIIMIPAFLWVLAGSASLYVASRGYTVSRDAPIQPIDTKQAWHLSLSRHPHHGPYRTSHLYSDGTILIHQWTNLIGGRVSTNVANRTAEWFNNSSYRCLELGYGGDGLSDFIRRIGLYRKDKTEQIALVEYWKKDLLDEEDHLLYWLMKSEDLRALSINYKNCDAVEEMLASETIDLDGLFDKLYALQNSPSRSSVKLSKEALEAQKESKDH